MAAFLEIELYRLLDVMASDVHASQTELAVAGMLVFVSQGHGVGSLVFVGGRETLEQGREFQFTALVRGRAHDDGRGGVRKASMKATAATLAATLAATSAALGLPVAAQVSLVDGGFVRLRRRPPLASLHAVAELVLGARLTRDADSRARSMERARASSFRWQRIEACLETSIFEVAKLVSGSTHDLASRADELGAHTFALLLNVSRAAPTVAADGGLRPPPPTPRLAEAAQTMGTTPMTVASSSTALGKRKAPAT